MTREKRDDPAEKYKVKKDEIDDQESKPPVF